MKNLKLIIALSLIYNVLNAQKLNLTPTFDEIKYDTNQRNIFEGYENAKIKIDYFHTEGYSLKDRFWYEVIIIDSLIILNFESPKNDDWNYINFQKQFIVENSVVQDLVLSLKNNNLKQIKKGIPIPEFTGYGANRLYVETNSMKIEGGNIYSCVGEETNENLSNSQEKIDKDYSTSIGGDYEKSFTKILSLFPQLEFLKKEMEN